MELKRILMLLALSLLFLSVKAQSDVIHTNSQVYIANGSNDGKYIAFADMDKVYIADIESFKIINTIDYNRMEKGLVSEMWFHPSDANSFWIRFSNYGGDMPMDFYEYPLDSIFLYNISTGKKILGLPGNSYVTFSTIPKEYVVAYNQYYSYENQGKTVQAAQKGGMIYYPQKQEYPSDKVIRGINMSPGSQYVAVSWYDSLHDGKPFYSLQIRDFKTHELLAEKSQIEGKPANIQFSDDSKSLIIDIADFSSPRIMILKTADLTDPKGNEVSDIKYRILKRKLIGIKDNAIVIINLETGKEEKTIWANLTNLSVNGGAAVNGSLFLNENEIIAFGYDIQDGGKGRISKLNIVNLGIFVNNEDKSGSDTLVEPEKIFIQNNQFNDGKITLNTNKDILLSASKQRLQVWQPGERNKLYDFSFKSDIKAFPDNEGNILVLEKYEQIGYSDYKLHIINLKTGLSGYSINKDGKYGEFSPNYKCDCFAEPGKPASWICSDFTDALWRITQKTLSAEKIFSIGKLKKGPNSEIRNIRFIPGTNQIIFDVIHEIPTPNSSGTTTITDSVVMFDMLNLKPKRVRELEKANTCFPISQQLFVISDNQGVRIKDPFLNKELLLLDRKDLTLIGCVAHQNIAYILLKQAGKDSILVMPYAIPENKFESSFAISKYTDNYFATKQGLNFVCNETINTFIPKTKTNIPWNQPSTDFISRNSFYMDESGHLLLGKNEFINCATLENKTVLPSYSTSALLKGASSGKIIYIKASKYLTDENTKPYFEFVIAQTHDYEKPIWKSEKFTIGDDELTLFDAIEVSPKGNFAAFYSSSSMFDSGRGVYLLNLTTKNIRKIPLTTVDNVVFSPDDKYIYIQGVKKNSEKRLYQVIDNETGKVKHILKSGFADFGAEAGTFLTADMYGVGLMELHGDSLEQKQFYYSRDWINVAMQTKSEGLLCGGSKNGNLYFWKPEKQSPVKIIKCGVAEIIKMEDVNGKLYVFLNDGNLQIIDLVNRTKLAEIQFGKRDEGNTVSWFTSEGYFKAQKEELANYHFIQGGKSYPVLSYEIFLNRPDIILKRLGYADAQTIDLYHAAYLKRLEKYGLKDDFNFAQLQRPEITILEKENLPLATSESIVEFIVEASSKDFAMKELYITVNGVPIYGVKGLQIPSLKQYSKKIKVTLGSGSNRILVRVKDDRGVESNPESFEIVSNRIANPHLYFIGVGVADYKDQTMDLKYSEADINLMASYFAYGQDTVKTTVKKILNAEVTRENLTALKQMLLKTDVDDVVVISFSGHGLLDDKYNFYFATYDMDFKNPSKRGFSYSEIEWLMDSIPARRKLLLMDACHSGEIDQSQGQGVQGPLANGVKGVAARGAEMLSDAKPTIGLQNSFELMQTLFADLNHSNGAFIISAAGGMEYAFEGEQWGNGVFTYSFINSMNDLSRKSGYQKQKVKISDLQKAVYNSVLQLTGGRQKPTTRTENIEWDWSL